MPSKTGESRRTVPHRLGLIVSTLEQMEKQNSDRGFSPKVRERSLMKKLEKSLPGFAEANTRPQRTRAPLESLCGLSPAIPRSSKRCSRLSFFGIETDGVTPESDGSWLNEGFVRAGRKRGLTEVSATF